MKCFTSCCINPYIKAFDAITGAKSAKATNSKSAITAQTKYLKARAPAAEKMDLLESTNRNEESVETVLEFKNIFLRD